MFILDDAAGVETVALPNNIIANTSVGFLTEFKNR